MKLKLIATAILMASAMPANATLLINGGFDDGLNNWVRGGAGTGFVQTSGLFFGLATPSAQFRSGSTNFKTLSQIVTTEVGKRYELTYSLLNQASVYNQINVTTGDATTSTVFDSAFADGFRTFTQQFVATSTSSKIEFAVNHGGVGGNFLYIDDAMLGEVVPEPGTWAMLITGFGLVGVASRRRRRALAA